MANRPLPRIVRLSVWVLSAFSLLLARTALAQDEASTLVEGTEPTQFAFNYGETETPRAAALGGAQRAAGNGASGLFMNPANMVQTRVYHIEALGQITPEYGRQVYGGSIVDSVTGRLAGGLSIFGGFLDPDGIDRSWLDIRLALAYPISDRFYVGLGGRYMKVTQDGLGVLGDSRASGGLRDPEGGRFAFVNIPTFDAGFTVRASDNIFLSIAGQNLSFPDDGIMPTTVGGGIAFANEDFTIEADGLADFTSYSETSARIMAGGELLAGDHIPLRLGYRFDQGADSHSISGGFGYIAREFSAELSVRRTVAGPEATMIVFGLGYFLESSGLTSTSSF
jgi:hypothetical protein